MAGFLRSLLDDYQAQMERHRNRPFLEAAMAACALSACAGGEITFSQRIRVEELTGLLDAMTGGYMSRQIRKGLKKKD